MDQYKSVSHGPFSRAARTAHFIGLASDAQALDAGTSSRTVAEYIIARLAGIGIRHAFGIPGDFSFPVDAAIENHSDISFVVCSNELNAAYAADGYARIVGAALLTTTYGVGELSVVNGVMGSKAERLPVFHLVGYPGTRLTRTRRVLHHTLGSGATNEFFDIGTQCSCISVIVDNPATVAFEMDRVIATALQMKQPAYIAIPKDVAKMRIPSNPATAQTLENIQCLSSPLQSRYYPVSDEIELKTAEKAIWTRLKCCKKPLLLISFMIARLGLADKVLQLIEKFNVPFALTPMDKGSLPEMHSNFIGMYKGEASSQSVKEAVSSADLILDVGKVLFDDLSTGFGTSSISREMMITIGHTYVQIGDESMKLVQERSKSYSPVFIGDMLDMLLEHNIDLNIIQFEDWGMEKPCSWPKSDEHPQGITYANMTGCVQDFLKAGDTLVCDVGTCSLFLGNVLLPDKCRYMNQTLWGAIGWGTPACLGACLANPKGTTLLVTGDGAHQLTANELGTMHRYGVSPIILVLNNGIFGIEEFLEHNALRGYNKIANWKYSQLPGALGCPWTTIRAETVGELQQALDTGRLKKTATYIEVVMCEKLLDPLTSSALSKEYMDQPRLLS